MSVFLSDDAKNAVLQKLAVASTCQEVIRFCATSTDTRAYCRGTNNLSQVWDVDPRMPPRDRTRDATYEDYSAECRRLPAERATVTFTHSPVHPYTITHHQGPFFGTPSFVPPRYRSEHPTPGAAELWVQRLQAGANTHAAVTLQREFLANNGADFPATAERSLFDRFFSLCVGPHAPHDDVYAHAWNVWAARVGDLALIRVDNYSELKRRVLALFDAVFARLRRDGVRGLDSRDAAGVFRALFLPPL